jgi:hypothetical protein
LSFSILLKRCTLSLFADAQIVTDTGDSSNNAKVEGIWSPKELGEATGYSRQTIIDSIHGKGRYPRRLYAQKIGKIWLIPDSHAENFIHWVQTGELLQEPPAPEKLYWGTQEIADAAGVSLVRVEQAVGGIRSTKGKYSYTYPPTLEAIRFGKAWLVRPEDAEKYICEKTENK